MKDSTAFFVGVEVIVAVCYIMEIIDLRKEKFLNGYDKQYFMFCNFHFSLVRIAFGIVRCFGKFLFKLALTVTMHYSVVAVIT